MKLLVILLLVSLSFGETIYVAVASSMRFAVEEVIREYKKRRGDVEVKISSGSSGNLYRQILGGSPYHVFISASEEYTRKLLEKNKIRQHRRLLKGVLVIYTTRDLDLSGGMKVLLKVEKIAVASPRHAPYGKASKEAMVNSGIYDRVKKKLVYGTNVAQAFQYAFSGGVDVGLVSLSLAKRAGKGSYVEVPENLYSPIIHTVALVKESEASKDLFNFLLSERAKEIFKLHGFKTF